MEVVLIPNSFPQAHRFAYQSIRISSIETKQWNGRVRVCGGRGSVCSERCSRGCSAGSGKGWPHQPGGHHLEKREELTGSQARGNAERSLGEESRCRPLGFWSLPLR